MALHVFPDNEQLSRQAAGDLLSWISDRPAPLICAASGDSPAGIYRELARQKEAGAWKADSAFFAGLDEWVGLNGSDRGSCRALLDEQLFRPLQVAEERLCFFNGRTGDLASELARMKGFVRQHGPLDVAVVGLGLNGHIGFNEPGVDPAHRFHVIGLDPGTIATGQKYFSTPQQLSKGITFGLATLMEAGHILLVVNGAHKASILKAALEGPVGREVPATLLRSHPSLHVYADAAAASLLTQTPAA